MVIYLDNAASTRVASVVSRAMAEASESTYGNSSSLHALGRRASSVVERSRETVARLIGAGPKEIVFTSGATEADNLAVAGASLADHGSCNHIVTTSIEHSAVTAACEELRRRGFDVTVVPVDSNGSVDPDSIRKSITGKTVLISVIMASNEVGVVQSIREIGVIARGHDLLFHVDAVQAVGKIPIDVQTLNVDLLTISAHKIHGPKGVGALYVRDGVRLEPIIHGGGHEFGRRSGTHNVVGIAGLAAAMQFVHDHREEHVAHMRAMTQRLHDGIVNRIDRVRVNSEAPSRLPNILNVSYEGVDGEAVVLSLDTEGICVSSGSACASGSAEPSPVLKAMGVPPKLIKGSVRFSLSYETTPGEIDRALEVLPNVIRRLRSISPLE